ncbi:MAG: spermidine/putrescine ABC transporter substrate-binding protein [Verrucomicrobiaceae bacterium]|nr:spermidine/putrescine ABC transporter substrate-binding protein [Verrucomicrobiaceae bacterium]
MKKRRFLRSLAATTALASCGRRHADTTSGEAPVLHLYMWADYIKPSLVQRFEQENRCRIVIDTFDSNEAMYAKLKAGATGFDIAVPSSYMVKLMKEQDMLAPIDRGMLPNIVNISGDVANKIYDKLMEHSVPYAVGQTVIAWRKDRIEKIDPTWAVFERPDVKMRCTLLNDMRETLGAALKALGHSINTRDEQKLAAARDLVLNWKRNTAKFDNEAYKTGIDSGEFSLVMGYSGDLFQVVSDNEKVGILVPREGITMSCDEFVILKEGRNPLLAHQFINFMLDAKVAAENMQEIGYVCPNKAALEQVPRSFLNHPAIQIPDEVKPKVEVIEDLGADLPKWTKVWDEVKAG